MATETVLSDFPNLTDKLFVSSVRKVIDVVRPDLEIQTEEALARLDQTLETWESGGGEFIRIKHEIIHRQPEKVDATVVWQPAHSLSVDSDQAVTGLSLSTYSERIPEEEVEKALYAVDSLWLPSRQAHKALHRAYQTGTRPEIKIKVQTYSPGETPRSRQSDGVIILWDQLAHSGRGNVIGASRRLHASIPLVDLTQMRQRVLAHAATQPMSPSN